VSRRVGRAAGRHSRWAYSSLCSPSGTSLPRKGCWVGLRIVLFEDCSAFTRVTACTLALSPIRDTLIEGFSHFVTSMTAPIASGWSGCRVGFTPTGKGRLLTAHTRNGHSERVESRAPGASLTRRLAGISADDGNQSDAHREGSGMLLYEGCASSGFDMGSVRSIGWNHWQPSEAARNISHPCNLSKSWG
jgi:hypothetical protein